MINGYQSPLQGNGPMMGYQNAQMPMQDYMAPFDSFSNQGMDPSSPYTSPWRNPMVPDPNAQMGGQMPGMSGWGKAQVGLQAGSALLQGILGWKQAGIAKDQLNFQKQAFNKNFAAQAQSTNTQLEDRQRARVAQNPNQYQGVDEYMARNRVNA